jgi:cytochrome c oxidase assembly protein subunit 11
VNSGVQTKPKSHKRVVFWLTLLVLAMGGYTFALIPLYSVLCSVTGLNGKVDLKDQDSSARYKIERSAIPARLVTVEFDVNRHQHIRCEIQPEHTALEVEPGVLTHTSYHIKNLSDKTLVIQAIPSISPGVAAKFLKKLECFCFTQQILKPYESATFALRFWLEPEIPEKVHRLTLSYTLFEIHNSEKERPRGT